MLEVIDNKLVISREEELRKFYEMKIEAESKIEEIENKLKEEAMEKCKELGVSTLENDFLKMTYKKPSQRTTIDSKRLKEEAPDIFEAYSKTSEVKESISISIK